jgi:hypothetical protein
LKHQSTRNKLLRKPKNSGSNGSRTLFYLKSGRTTG